MDASILIVGSSGFLALFLETIQSLTQFTLEAASEPRDAISIVQAQQPDLLILEAALPECLDLCHQIKSQSQLAWIYCIVVDEQALPVDQQAALRQQLAEAEANALTSGADAYFAVNSVAVDPTGTTGVTEAQKLLLKAKIQAGLRQVQTHRELMRTNDILSAIALTDPLTELNNRRAFEWELPRQIQNARIREMPISLIMLDVDYFKDINDTYGHLVGDNALKLIAARLRHNLRFYDTPFRYGGEEFVVILSDTDGHEAVAIAQRLCRLISSQPFAIRASLDLTITISAGSATLLPSDDARGTSLLNRADQNMLRAKALGRNQVISSLEDENLDLGPSQPDFTEEDETVNPESSQPGDDGESESGESEA
ncbi:diguanylate cyclase [Leptolyngbya sp. AN02str]|uniref:GGDEF domain-containing response regulator n=1 Tax=Leptolyngbya sp. AN02str TaxID=3423363 RepID=UPI003D31388C